jgi:hypothetical protein
MNEELQSSGTAIELEGDRFLVEQKLSVGDKYVVGDEQGRPLVLVTSSSRLGSLVLATVVAGFAFVVACILGMFALIGIVGMFGGAAALQRIDTIESLSVVLCAGMVAGLIFLRFLPQPCYRFVPHEGDGGLLLELRPHRTLGLSSCYSVLDANGVCLADLVTNHLKNALRVRWYGYGPGRQPLVVVQDDARVPGFIRRPLQFTMTALLGFLILVGILIGLQGDLRIALLVLGGFAALFLVIYRWLQPNCLLLKPDTHGVIGVLDRKTHVEKQRNLLDLSPDPERYLDRRVALALAVLLYQK